MDVVEVLVQVVVVDLLDPQMVLMEVMEDKEVLVEMVEEEF